jgi:hypothetical protein
MLRHSGKAKFKKTGAFPECLGTWHSGKGKLKKRRGPSPSAWAPGTRGRQIKKKDTLFPECQVYRHTLFPECQVPRHSGKRFKK